MKQYFLNTDKVDITFWPEIFLQMDEKMSSSTFKQTTQIQRAHSSSPETSFRFHLHGGNGQNYVETKYVY